ncbi:MAG: acetylornithine deacetylase [Ectothiorhodospiraceae bacterium AqS1]|nr:acetylornithine deacetylase [Ectothiorhodospiraceae bacterium AqS1]
MTSRRLTSRELIEKLVGFPTVSCDSNLDLIHFVKDYLASHGIESTLIPNEDGSKANLLASIGPQTSGGIVLSGHTDVVPVVNQPWESDPFTVVERSGRLFGRGTADMKSFYAIALSLVPRMLERGIKRPIHFALSYDEEVGCLGAPGIIDKIVAGIPTPAAVIVGEPTMMRVTSAHKGIVTMETTVTGREAHSSQTHRGVSAVMNAARLIARIDEMARTAAADVSDIPFDPPYTTIHVGKIEGGTATNIISRHCRFLWDIRPIPGDDPSRYREALDRWAKDTLLPGMQAIDPDSGISTRTLGSVPALAPEPQGEAERLVRSLTGDNAVHAAAYAAEAGQFQAAGFSTVICGPGSIDQAHQANEFIDLAQVAECERFIERLIDHLAD